MAHAQDGKYCSSQIPAGHEVQQHMLKCVWSRLNANRQVAARLAVNTPVSACRKTLCKVQHGALSAVMTGFCAKHCDHSAPALLMRSERKASKNICRVLGQARVFIGFASASHVLFWVAST